MLISTLVHKTQIETGAEETSESLLANGSIPQTPPTSPHELRGSYRLLPYAGKQDRNDFKGLTSPTRKKRRTGKKSSTTINKPSEMPASKNNKVVTEAEKHGDRITATDESCGMEKQRIDEVSTATTNGKVHLEVTSSASFQIEGESFSSKLYTSVSELSNQYVAA